MIATITNLTTGPINIRNPAAALAATGQSGSSKAIAGLQYNEVIENPELLNLLSHASISVVFSVDPADNAALSFINTESVISARIAAVTVAAGLCVYLTATGQLGLADSTDGTKRAIGISVAGAASTALCTFVKSGIAKGVLTAATPGTPYYLNTAGTLTTTFPVTAGHLDQLVGYANSATDLYVQLDNGQIHP
jgi:hypothetical protein